MKLTLKKLSLTAIILTLFTLTGCGGGSDDSNTSTLKVIHNSPDAPNVDVLVDGSVALANISYGAISDDLIVDSGERNISVNVANTDNKAIEATLDLAKDTKYLIFASDTVSKIKPIVLVSSNETPSEDNSIFRVLHGAPGAPSVDIYATAPNSSIDAATPILSNLSFGQSSEYITVPSGSYQITVTLAGTKLVAIDAGVVTLENKGVYTVFAKDNLGGGAPFSLGLIQE